MYSNPGIDPKNGFYKAKIYKPKTDYKPYKPPTQPYKPPPYKDPLRSQMKEYKGNFEPPKFKPYKNKQFSHEYKEYKGPSIDPLTGKPYKRDRRPPAPKPVREPEETTQEKEPEKPPSPPTTKAKSTGSFGSSVMSVSRTLNLIGQRHSPVKSSQNIFHVNLQTDDDDEWG